MGEQETNTGQPRASTAGPNNIRDPQRYAAKFDILKKKQDLPFLIAVEAKSRLGVAR